MFWSTMIRVAGAWRTIAKVRPSGEMSLFASWLGG